MRGTDGPAAFDPTGDHNRYPQQGGDELQPFQEAQPADLTPPDLYRYTGRGAAVYETVDRIRDFAAWSQRLRAQKPQVTAEQMEGLRLLVTRFPTS